VRGIGGLSKVTWLAYEYQTAARKVIHTWIILKRDCARLARKDGVAAEADVFDSANPVRRPAAVNMVVPAILTGEGVRYQDRLAGRREGPEDIVQKSFLDVLKEFARPDQIGVVVRKIRSVANIVQDHALGNDIITQRPLAALYALNPTAEVAKIARGLPLAAPDIQDGRHVELPHGPLPEVGAPRSRIASAEVASQMPVLDHLQIWHAFDPPWASDCQF
jgi:hypothetical protein